MGTTAGALVLVAGHAGGIGASLGPCHGDDHEIVAGLSLGHGNDHPLAVHVHSWERFLVTWLCLVLSRRLLSEFRGLCWGRSWPDCHDRHDHHHVGLDHVQVLAVVHGFGHGRKHRNLDGSDSCSDAR